MMVILAQLNNLFVTFMEVRGCKQSTVQEWTCLVRPRQSWISFLQHVMFWSSMFNVPTTRPRFGFWQRWKLLLRHCPPDAWRKESGYLTPQWTRLSPVPLSCLELVTCSCKTKCKKAGCTRFKTNLKCTNACDCCESVDCCNPSF